MGLHATALTLDPAGVQGGNQAGGLAGALWRQSARLRRPALCLWLATPLAAMWCGMALATAYAWFSGWGVPAQRTCTMLLTVALLRTWGMTWPWQAILATAAATGFPPKVEPC